MRTHELKCWPEYYEQVASGRKSFEIRVNDRDYQVGDTVAVLRRGNVFVSIDVATTAGSLSAPWAVNANVQHPSTTAASATNTNGYFTAVAANTTAGTETTAAPGCYFERVVASGLAILAVNKPKSA